MATDLMDQLHKGLSEDFETSRDGNTVTLNRLKPKKAPAQPAEEPTSGMKDVMQTRKNEKAYEGYEKRKAKGFKAGGKVSSRGDGCAQRGKTRGRMI